MSDDKKEDANLVKIRRGIRGALARAPIERIELRHMAASGGESVALALEGESLKNQIKTSGGLEAAASMLAEELLESAEEEAKTLRGVNRYGVCIYREGDRDYKTRVLFTIRGSRIEDSDSIEETEPSNEKGLISQVMRHNEVLAKTSAMHHERILERYDAMHREDRQTIMHLLESHTKVLELHENLMDRRMERELEYSKEKRKEALTTKGLETVMMLAGPLMKKMLPENSVGQTVADDSILIQLISSLKEEQVAGLLQVLEPQQQAAFFELYQSLKKRYEKVKISQDEKSQQNGTTPHNQEQKT